jgi:hypothetical protein
MSFQGIKYMLEYFFKKGFRGRYKQYPHKILLVIPMVFQIHLFVVVFVVVVVVF